MIECTYMNMGDIRALVNEVLVKLDCPHLVNKIKLEFNNRFDSRLGDANFSLLRIRFSAPLWGRASLAERKQVIIHEACHIAAGAYQVAGKTKDMTAHGNCWKQCMIRCGVQPDRCHTVSTAGLRDKVKATCMCKCWEITKNRATKMMRGMRYSCQNCKANLSLVQRQTN